MRRHHARSCSRRAGFTLLEVLVASTLLVVILYGALTVIWRDTALSRQVLHTGNVEQLSQEMLYQVERELENAHGRNPTAILTVTLTPGVTSTMTVSSTLGFPNSGILLLDRGTPAEERIAYSGLLADQVTFTGLTRGEQCTPETEHLAGGEVLWTGIADPLALPGEPPPSLWDGVTQVLGESRWFRGDGSGFCYRVPVDPAGGTNYLEGDDVQWGATIHDAPTLDGWVTLYFEPRIVYDESTAETDLNGDGDRDDRFDVGQIRRRAWNAADPNAPVQDTGMGPTAVIQERCNWGSDLDFDAFDDPLFYYDKERRQLRIRLFLLGSLSGQTVVRQVDTLMFLRNHFEG